MIGAAKSINTFTSRLGEGPITRSSMFNCHRRRAADLKDWLMTPESLRQSLGDFLSQKVAAVVVEDGAVVFDLSQ